MLLGGALLVGLLVEIRHVPDFQSVLASHLTSRRVLVDRNGRILGTTSAGVGPLRMSWLPIGQVPRPTLEVFVQAQESRFYWNPGFDLIRLAEEGLRLMLGGHPHSANGIAMQVVDRIYPSPKRKTFVQKIHQLIRAIALEVKWRKSQILTVYLNTFEFRGLQGLPLVAEAIFDKSVTRLAPAEGALLAAASARPGRSLVELTDLACQLLTDVGRAEECGALDSDRMARLEQSFRMSPIHRPAPFNSRWEKTVPADSPNTLLAVLDRELQWMLSNLLKMDSPGLVDARAVLIDNTSGEIRALIEPEKQEGQRIRTSMIILPFLCARALDARLITPNTRVRHTAGLSFAEACTSEDERTAWELADLLGKDALLSIMRQLSLIDPGKARDLGPSLGDGGFETDFIAMANAYRTLVNEGVWSPTRWRSDELSEEASARVISPQATYIINSWTQRKDNRSFVRFATSTEGTWAVGFTSRYTLAIWAHAPVEELAAAWHKSVEKLNLEDDVLFQPRPEGLIEVTHQTEKRWFLAGTETIQQNSIKERISYPRERMTIEVDSPAERIYLQVSRTTSTEHLFMDQKWLGLAQARVAWPVEAGAHILELRDATGEIRERVRFEVRIR